MNDCFPKMVPLVQHFPVSPESSFSTRLREEFSSEGILSHISPGMRIAVGVGSRGITNLAKIVSEVLRILSDAGAKPFIVPAMGSHGGATPEGQEKVLAELGVTRKTMGVPFESSMEVHQIGKTPSGRDVVFSVPALQADGIVVVNRIKPHTDFFGDLGSGIQKMLAIGFGKHVGAANAHQAASQLGHERVIRETAKVILDTMPVLCGVALLEDQRHHIAHIKVMRAKHVVEEEPKLLIKARSLMAQLPFQTIDLLIVDQIGKEYSGTGMDTNVIGRGVLGYSASLSLDNSLKPQIFRIFVRDLTAATNGNGIGIGLADFTTTRAVKTLNLSYMYINAVTSLGLPTAKIPMYFETDREAITTAITSLASSSPQELRIARIANTLKLEQMLVSETLAKEASSRSDLSLVGPPQEMEFDKFGNLLPFKTNGDHAEPSPENARINRGSIFGEI